MADLTEGYSGDYYIGQLIETRQFGYGHIEAFAYTRAGGNGYYRALVRLLPQGEGDEGVTVYQHIDTISEVVSDGREFSNFR